MSRRVLGIDVSLAHGGFVLLVDGALQRYQFVTDRKKVAEKNKACGTYLFTSKIPDKQQRDTIRLSFWNVYIKAVIASFAPDFVGVEDYAFRATQSSYHLGEVGGAVKYYVFMSGARLRLHDPMSLKMYAVHQGNADSRETREGIEERWPEAEREFHKYIQGADERTTEDLCDGFAIAKLVDLEVSLRAGSVRLDQLPPKEVQVFNRCTKRYPVSLLARDWISKESE